MRAPLFHVLLPIPTTRRGLSSLSEMLSQIALDSRSRKELVEQVKALGRVVSQADWDPNSRGGGGGISLTPDHVRELIRALRGEPVWALRVYIWATRQPSYRHNALVRSELLELWQPNDLLEPFLHVLENPSDLNAPEKYSLLIKGYGWAHMPDVAMATLRRMKSSGFAPDVSHFNSLLYVLVQSNRLKNIRELYKHMLESGVCPNSSTYALRVRGYCVARQFDEALKAFRQMLKSGFPPDIRTFGYLIDSMCKANKAYLLYVILCDLHEHRCSPDVTIYHEMLEGLCRNNCVKYAEKLVKLIAERGVDASAAVCNILVKGLCQERKLQNALVLVNDMLKKGFLPNPNVFEMVLILLFKEGRLGNIFKLLDKLMEKGFAPHVSSYNILIYGLSKCEEVGKAFEAWNILVQFCLPSVKSYRALVEGLCRSGRLTEAKEVFKTTMDKSGTGDAAAHDALLYRLKQAGRVNDVRECQDILDARRQACDDQIDIFERVFMESTNSGHGNESLVDQEIDISVDEHISDDE